MMEQQIPGTPGAKEMLAPQQQPVLQQQSGPMSAILPQPAAQSQLGHGQVFKSQRTISKLSQGDTLFRLFSEGPTSSSNKGDAPGPGGMMQEGSHAVDSQGSPRGDGDNQDSLFKLFTAPQSVRRCPPHVLAPPPPPERTPTHALADCLPPPSLSPFLPS